ERGRRDGARGWGWGSRGEGLATDGDLEGEVAQRLSGLVGDGHGSGDVVHSADGLSGGERPQQRAHQPGQVVDVLLGGGPDVDADLGSLEKPFDLWASVAADGDHSGTARVGHGGADVDLGGVRLSSGAELGAELLTEDQLGVGEHHSGWMPGHPPTARARLPVRASTIMALGSEDSTRTTARSVVSWMIRRLARYSPVSTGALAWARA